MLNTVRTYIESHGLLAKEASVVVAVSGGADSVCLLHVLHDLGYSIVAAHCNFHLRGEESDRDEAFVRKLCKEQDIPLVVKHFATKEHAATTGISIEMAARELRYAWFEELREEHRCEAVCVAHHMNDQAETLLLNLQRGTGIRGLVGMKPKNGRIVRPMLCVTRTQIEAYAKEKGYLYVTDSTNADTSIRRNAIRALLATWTETEIAHMAHTAELMGEYDLLLQSLLRADSQVPKMMDSEAEKVLLYELLRPYGFNSTQVDNILATLPSSGQQFRTEHYTACIDHGKLRVSSNEGETAVEGQEEEVMPVLVRSVRAKKEKEHYPAASEEYALFDADLLPENLGLRHWIEGDSFLPICNHGKAQRKKLQDLFSDKKLSLHEKHAVWIVCDADKPTEIVWVVGHRISNKYKITEKTTRVVELQIER